MMLLLVAASAVVLWVLVSFVVAIVVGRAFSTRMPAPVPAEPIAYSEISLPRAS